MKSFRNFRLIPVVLASITCLAGLKIMGLVLYGGYIFDDRSISSASSRNSKTSSQMSWAQSVFNFPSGAGRSADTVDITGSVEKKEDLSKPEKKSDAKSEAKGEANPSSKLDTASEEKNSAKSDSLESVVILSDKNRPVPASERAILERLQERRQELEARAREIDIRENLLKVAEKRIEGRMQEIKAAEARLGSVTEQKNQADAARLKGIVSMYETMKPKDAAKIFDRLDMSILIDVVSQIPPRKMSDILGSMQPEVAERLTVEMARHAGGDKTASASDLPKIEGKSTVDGNN